MTWYHGGPSDLPVILPASITGAMSTSDLVGDTDAHDRTCVYITASYEAAAMFAVANRLPSVYTVEPSGTLGVDRDAPDPALSATCAFARVLTEKPLRGASLRLHRKRALRRAAKGHW